MKNVKNNSSDVNSNNNNKNDQIRNKIEEENQIQINKENLLLEKKSKDIINDNNNNNGALKQNFGSFSDNKNDININNHYRYEKYNEISNDFSHISQTFTEDEIKNSPVLVISVTKVSIK
jgi:hypothetical protein